MKLTTYNLNQNGNSANITEIMAKIPANITTYILTNNNTIWLETEEIDQDTYNALSSLLGGLVYTPPVGLQFSYGVCNSPTGLNIRSEAATTSSVAGVLDMGQRCKFDKSFINDSWYKILSPINGYVYKEYISTATTPTAPSQALINFTASWEGFSSTAYQDIAGNWTIGFGDCTFNQQPNYTVTREQALQSLTSTLSTFSQQIYGVTKDLDLTQNQFDSIVDFCYNEGFEAFQGSDLKQAIVSCQNDGLIAGDFGAWDAFTNSQGELQTSLGLQRRRTAETQMFIYNQYNNN